MTQPDVAAPAVQRQAGRPDADRTADLRAAATARRHHAHLAQVLGHISGELVSAAEDGAVAEVWLYRAGLMGWLRAELLRHVAVEEGSLYPLAATTRRGRLLVDGMRDDHVALRTLAGELERAATPVRAAAAAHALHTLFLLHLARDNDTFLPMLVDTVDVSLADALDAARRSADAPVPRRAAADREPVGGVRPAVPGVP